MCVKVQVLLFFLFAMWVCPGTLDVFFLAFLWHITLKNKQWIYNAHKKNEIMHYVCVCNTFHTTLWLVFLYIPLTFSFNTINTTMVVRTSRFHVVSQGLKKNCPATVSIINKRNRQSTDLPLFWLCNANGNIRGAVTWLESLGLCFFEAVNYPETETQRWRPAS